jgi:hypothetical protein
MTARARLVFAQELGHLSKRPLLWFLVALLALMTWGLSTGDVQIASGDSSVGGTKAWLTSEFSFAFILAAEMILLYSFFASIGAGLAVLRDDELRMGELLHSTPLRPGEYVWGKFLAVLCALLGVVALHLGFVLLFNHLLPSAEAAEIRGPFEPLNYLRPVLVFALPCLIFFAGVTFYLGERWRRPVTVFLFPVAVLLVDAFFLWDWSPTWLDPRINRALMMIDPGGFRWLNETWLKLDRGARFYNTARIGLDLPFVLSRLAFAGLGLLGVELARRHLARTLRGAAAPSLSGRRRLALPRWRRAAEPEERVAPLPPSSRPLAGLGMRVRPVGFLESAVTVAGVELRNLLASPGLYLFSVLILLQTLGGALSALGPFGTPVLLSSGLVAVSSMNPLTSLLCLLLIFYTAASLERDRMTGLAEISYAAPAPTAGVLFGRALANSAVAVAVMLAAFVGLVVALLIQRMSQPAPGLELRPFLLVWGLLLIPTFLVWTSFVTAVQAISGQRFVTYGLALAALAITLFCLITHKMTWVGNWPLWSAVPWSDMGAFELDRRGLILNRIFALGLSGLFTAAAVRFWDRRQADAIATLHRLHPAQAGRAALRMAVWAVVPAVSGVMLWLAVMDGWQGERVEKKGKDYWKANLATWKGAPEPAIAAVDLDLRLDPQRRWFHDRGSFELVNDHEAPLGRFALTGGPHWRKVRWTLDGVAWKPVERSGLYEIVPPRPLPPGGHVRVGFDFEGRLPDGSTRNGGGAPEFILPSGVVLTSFRPTFSPLVGYQEDIGIKKGENDYEPKEETPDFYVGRTPAAFGSNRSFRTRIRVTGPAEYAWNSVGTRVSDRVEGGLRTSVWESDRPVRFYNVVGGRWAVRRGHGTAIYYHPGHPYNIAAMSRVLDASRRWYSAWFHPYPWRELKLSEFPGLASYAQGFPTDITFSEGIGFLTRGDEKADAVFVVTAHETAHQWWGNLVTPGEGPGGNVLSEGMAHFSTLMLMEHEKGEHARMELGKRLEERYGDERRVDVERPLVRLDGRRDGDTTVTYDKGGWVFWMLREQLGPERMQAGLRRFIDVWADSPDHPVLQDFVATMRPFAADPAAYDDFVRQWFFQVVVPEYEVSRGRIEKTAGGWVAIATVRNAGTGRMPVEIAAVRGERFPEKGKKPKPGAGPYRDARVTLVLGPGESRTVRIACPFSPERVIVDPDVRVLQLRRKAAVADLTLH